MQKRALPALLLLVLAAAAAEARLLSREEALNLAFPGAEIRQSMLFLTDAEIKEASTLAGSKIESAMVARFDAIKAGNPAGFAYLETHVVRTKKESLLVILDAQGKILRVEVVAFLEPPEYMPPDRWYRQFDGRALSEDLQMKRSIHPVTGATLTAKATTDAARRALAIHNVLSRRTEKKP